LDIDVHRKGGGIKQHPPPSGPIFEKRVNKIAIKPKTGDSPRYFILKALTPPPPGILAKIPAAPLGFQPVCIYGYLKCNVRGTRKIFD
jgi:hypothetical protein